MKSKYLTLLISLALADSVVYAKKQPARKASPVKAAPRNDKAVVQGGDVAPVKPQNDKAVGITKYNAADMYAKCMGAKCFDKAVGYCKCQTADNADCVYIAEAVPYMTLDVLAGFQRKAEQDCASYSFANTVEPVSLAEAVADLTVCMRKNCKSRLDEFAKCFDDGIFDEQFAACGDSYKGYSDEEALRAEFKKSIYSYKTSYCNNSWGEMAGDDCVVEIGIGLSPQTIAKRRKFKVGDAIICSQSEFGTALSGPDINAMQAKGQIITGSIGLVGNVLRNTNSIVQVAGTREKTGQDANGKDVYKTTGGNKLKVGNAVFGLAGDLVGDGINVAIGVMMLGMPKPEYPAICYAVRDGQTKPMFYEDPQTYYKLAWSESWSTQGRTYR